MPSNTPSPEELFAEFLIEWEDTGDADIERYCERASASSAELRELHRAWEEGRGRLAQVRAPGHEPFPDTPVSGIDVPVYPGKRIGPFQLVRRLGQGGMGQVWEARDDKIGRGVALKLIRPDRATARAVQLFEREARAGGRLTHRNLVTVLSAGEAEGIHYIAQELIEGERTLRTKLLEARESEELPPDYYRNITEFFARVAEALEVAHQAGVIHRDLKPQNILIAAGEEPKVGDFGLARLVDELSLSMTGDLVGTYYYMSPEQVAARRAGIDHRSDIFSLGAVLYEALSFQRPFEGDTSQQVVHQIVFEDPPDPRKLRSRVPEDLAVICAKALEKSPRQRYATMGELAADLRRHLEREPIHARPPGPLRRVGKWASRHPTLSTLVGVGAVSLLTISLLFARNLTMSTALAASRDEAENNEALALKKVREVFDLSAAGDVRALVEEAERLWPAHPDNEDAYRDWLERARQLVAGLDTHRERLAEVRARALPPEPIARDEHPSFRELGERQRQLEELRDAYASLDALAVEHAEEGRERDAARLVPMLEQYTDTIEWLDREIRRLERDMTAHELRFASSDDRWWFSQLEQLIRDLEALDDPDQGLIRGLSREHGRGIEQRLAFAESIAERSVAGDRAALAWEDAIASIADPNECPEYSGLRITPQVGLVPIGRDPNSRLWEFAHLESGEQPTRDAATGRLNWSPSSGIVFVLLPGGSFFMGAQPDDPSAPNYDPDARPYERPVHEVQLAPFFLSKFELTQGQWQRLAGWNPSQLQNSDAHPVESLDSNESAEFCRRLGLSLPTEAQWEYACRSGSTTPFCFGPFSERLGGYGNVKDRQYTISSGSTDPGEAFDDGSAGHAPVGSYIANSFGVHDMHGNVQEWCGDQFGSYEMPTDSNSGARLAPPSSERGPNLRGGSFVWRAFAARSGARLWQIASFSGQNAGFRPARSIEP